MDIITYALLKGKIKAVSNAAVVTDAATPGAIASFPDGSDGLPLKSLVASIEPVQDLHGQDAPYPPGGGKNVLPLTVESLKAINISFPWDDDSTTINGVTFTILTNEVGDVTGIKVNGTAISTADFKIGGAYNTTNLFAPSGRYTISVNTTAPFLIAGYANNAILTSGGAQATGDCNDGVAWCLMRVNSGVTVNNVTATPMVCLASAPNPTTFAPYSNECPISGWTGLEGKRTGKNLLRNRGNSGSSNGITWNIRSDGSVELSGTATERTYVGFNSGTNRQTIGKGPVSLSASSTASYNPGISGINFQNDIYVNDVHIKTLQRGGSTYAFSDGIISVGISRLSIAPGTVIPQGTIFYPQIEIGSETSDYEQYFEENLSVSWQDTAGAVYGGTMTVNEDGSGELVANMASVDLGTLTWSKNTDSFGINFFSNSLQNLIKPSTGGTYLQNILCSNYESLSWYNYATSSSDMCTAQVQSQIRIKDSTFSSGDAAAFKTAMSGVQFVYELATPQTYHFDNLTQLTTVLGTNNIWVDCGQTTAEYRADSKLYIDKKLAALVAALS